MFKVTPKGVLFLLSYFPGYRIHLYIPATHFFYGVYQQLHVGPKPGLGRFPNKQMFDVPAEEPECHLFPQNLLHSFVTSWLNVNKYQFSIYA